MDRQAALFPRKKQGCCLLLFINPWLFGNSICDHATWVLHCCSANATGCKVVYELALGGTGDPVLCLCPSQLDYGSCYPAKASFVAHQISYMSLHPGSHVLYPCFCIHVGRCRPRDLLSNGSNPFEPLLCLTAALSLITALPAMHHSGHTMQFF